MPVNDIQKLSAFIKSSGVDPGRQFEVTNFKSTRSRVCPKRLGSWFKALRFANTEIECDYSK